MQDKNRELNRLQKMLEGANIKLSGTVRDINGKSAHAILEVLVSKDAIDSKKYDEMVAEKKITGRLKTSKEQILDDVNGIMSPLQRQMMHVLLSHIDELNAHIKELDDQIDDHMKPDEKQTVEAIKEVTGLGVDSSRIIISVIGTDMDRFPTDAHLASWAGMCPGDNESAKNGSRERPGKGTSYCGPLSSHVPILW